MTKKENKIKLKRITTKVKIPNWDNSSVLWCAECKAIDPLHRTLTQWQFNGPDASQFTSIAVCALCGTELRRLDEEEESRDDA